MPYRMGSPTASWTYEALHIRKGWRKVSNRILLTVSANRAFCLTLDAKSGVAYVECFADFADFAGKG